MSTHLYLHAQKKIIWVPYSIAVYDQQLLIMNPQGNSDIHSCCDGIQQPVNDKANAPAPVAIIGMSCRLSGDVSSLDDFWQMICRGRNGWSEIPEDRFSKDAFWHPNPAKKGAFNPRGGYFIKQDPSLFDAPFFNITRAEAEAMGMFSFLISAH